MNSLWELATSSGAPAGEILAPDTQVPLAALLDGTTLRGELEALRGLSVLIAMEEQLSTALAILELDGVVRRMVLCTPDLSGEQLSSIAAMAQVDAVVVDESAEKYLCGGLPQIVSTLPIRSPVERRAGEQTEWILLTSGSTGMPKMVVHTLETLAGALPRRESVAGSPIWSTFYDIRRYGGLQIYLRAVIGGSRLVLSDASKSPQEFLARAGAAGVTHLSGTPSHWRRGLMSGAPTFIRPDYVRLSGEVADQPVLDALRTAFPDAKIAHAFASTEAGVAFAVNDGRAGFPRELFDGIGAAADGVELRVIGGTLRIRSRGVGRRYLGAESDTLSDADGFVDTGDLVEAVADRYYFRGRRGGVINVGGMKVYPEEVEAVLNADPRVRMSRVRGRRNPITGAVVMAEVVLLAASSELVSPDQEVRLKAELLSACRQALPAHKVPAVLRLVPHLELTPAGKLVRSDE